MMSQLRNVALGVAVMLSCVSPLRAQQVAYQPVDPGFGGSPFNSTRSPATAKTRTKYEGPSARKTNAQAEIFARQLQSRLFSALSWQITDAIFGDDPERHGAIALGHQTIVFDRGLEEVTLTITDHDTGDVTNIVVPTFANAP